MSHRIPRFDLDPSVYTLYALNWGMWFGSTVSSDEGLQDFFEIFLLRLNSRLEGGLDGWRDVKRTVDKIAVDEPGVDSKQEYYKHSYIK